MPSVIKFPPNLACHICNVKMRPATRTEITKGIADNSLSHFYNQAVQGDTTRKLVKEDCQEWVEDNANFSSWLMICDTCGGKVLWSIDDE